MQGGWKDGKGDMGAGGVVGNMKQDVGGCKNMCVRLWVGWGNIKGYCGVIRERVQRDFVGHGEEGGECWSLHPPCTDKRHHSTPCVSAEPRLGWVRPSWIWGEKVNIYLGLFLTILAQKEQNAGVEMTY